MKKLFSLISMFVLCLCGMAAGNENTMNEAYRIEVWGEPGQVGRTAELTLIMVNKQAVGTWNCTLELPEGVIFQSAVVADGEEGRYPEDYNPQLTCTPNEAGNVISFSCYGSEGVGIPNGEGAVAVVTVNIANTVAAGEYTLVVKNIQLIEPNESIHNYQGQKEFAWTIEEAPLVQGTIYFNTNGGEPAEIDPITQEVGTDVEVPEDPTRVGYTFSGWDPAVPATMPEGETTCVAQWTINQYTITFDSNGGSAVDPITQDYDTEVTAPEAPTWEGHIFRGWDPAVPERMPAEDITCVAQWEVETYTVTIIGDGVTADNMTPQYGETVNVTVEDRDGYVVTLKVNDEPVELVEGKYVIEFVTGNITLEATYEAVVEFFTPTQQYTMFSCERALDFTDCDVKAYIATGFNNAINYALLEEIQVVPAGTGVMLIAEVGETYKIPYAEVTTQTVVEGNLFVAALQGMTLSPAGQDVSTVDYVYDAALNGFTPVPEEGIQLPAQSAYLQLLASEVISDAVIRVGILDNADAITNVKLNAGENAIFDLQGRRVSQTTKGIYIVNGKKIAVK